MLKTRILLALVSAALIWLIFLLPKAAVENDNQLAAGADSTGGTNTASGMHQTAPAEVLKAIRELRARVLQGPLNQKNAIFADSLAVLYTQAGQLDSAAWFAGQAASFFNTQESFIRAGNRYYDAYTFAMDPKKQQELAFQTQDYYGKVLAVDPQNLDIKSKLAMTYVSSAAPMKGITMLREVLTADPKNQTALFNMGLLSVQSGQYERAIERLEELVSINPEHIQGQLLLGAAYLNKGDKVKAKALFEKVKQLDQDPSVQATVDSYLKDLK